MKIFNYLLKSSFFKFFQLSLVILLFFTLFSCAKRNENSKIRLVDLKGNAKPIKTMVPQGNLQMIAKQNKIDDKTNLSKNTTQESNKEQNLSISKPENITQNPDIFASKNNMAEAKILYDSNLPNDEKNLGELNNNSQKSLNFEPDVEVKKPKSNTIFYKQRQSNKFKAKSSGIFIQIGNFSSYQNANKALEEVNKISNGATIEEVSFNGKKTYKVLLDAGLNKKNATNILNKFKTSGYEDAFIIK